MSDSEAADQLIEAFDRLSGKLDRALKSTNNSSIVFNSGGIAPWVPTAIALFCAGLIFGAVAIGGFWASREFSRADAERGELRKRDADFQDYISVIYQIAPELQKRLEPEKVEEQQP